MAIEDYFSYPEFGSYDLRKYRVPASGNPAMAYGPNEYVEFPMYMDNQVVLPAPLPVTPPAVMPAPVAPSSAMPTPAAALPQPQGIAPAPVLPIPQKRMAPSINFDQFPIPTPPPARQMPMRDLAGERRQQSQVSLRAGLIGLLLGGGTGALAGLTGAQQGFQQAAEQDYQQRLAGFQSEQQQAQQDYSNRVAMTNAMLARAQAERQQGQEFLDTDYANMIAARNEQIRIENERIAQAKRAGEISDAEAKRRVDQLEAASKFGDPAVAMEFLRTGTIPAQGFGATSKQIDADTKYFRGRANDLFKNYGTNPKVYKEEARKFNASVDQSGLPEAVKASLKVAEAEIGSPALLNLRLREQQFNEDVRQFGMDYAQRAARERNAEEERVWRRGFDTRRAAAREEIDRATLRIRELEARKKAAAKDGTTPGDVKISSEMITGVTKSYNSLAKEVAAIEKDLASTIKAALMDETWRKAQRGRVDALKETMRLYSEDPNLKRYVRFTYDPQGNVYVAAPGLKTDAGKPIENPTAAPAGSAGLSVEELKRKYGASGVGGK